MTDDVGHVTRSDELDAEDDSLLRAVARAPSVDPGPAAGDVVDGAFRIESKLGAGGMGVVYLARDLRLQRPVALKLHSRADGAERTKREARVLARLVHPNVVTIYDVGVWRSRTYIAMEYLDGGTLRTWLDARPRTWREVLSLFMQAARGLESAHRAGVIHRDFKPDNVLLGADGRVRVADFGLARPLDGSSPPTSDDERPAMELAEASDASQGLPLTAAGTRIGTPGWMAPEAERGDALDARADQYSFCATLRAALVGRKAPSWLGVILARGLAPDPERRHASMAALITALDRRLRLRRWRIAPVLLVATAGAGALASLAPSQGGSMSAPPRPVCPAPELPVLHVNAAAAPGGNGSTACPFRTLTEALAVKADRRTIQVAAGRYDVAHGETLPLVIRGATEVRGNGADTVISGLGYYHPGHDDLAVARLHQRATLVIGDDQDDVMLSGISVESGQSEIADGNFAILCSRGNLHAFDGPIPPPNTRLDQITVGPGYDIGLVVTGSTSPRLTGCNLSLTHGAFNDVRAGVWQVGCGRNDSAAPTALEVVHTSFHVKRAKPLTGGVLDAAAVSIGVGAWDCARRLRVADSEFVDGDYGINIVRHDELQPGAVHDPRDPPAVIERNEFTDLNIAGIYLEYAPHVKFLDNRLWGLPTALAILSAPHQTPRVRARGNRFWNNGLAVEVRGQGELPRDTEIDFGRPADPGRNSFSCNAVRGEPAITTIAMRMAVAPGVLLGFAGNTWDHVPPRVRRGRPAGDRVEIALTAGSARIQLGDAAATGEPCRSP